MADYFEIDFLDVETAKSGDAISIRYEIGGKTFIHVVDGGYQSTGEKLSASIKTHYGNPSKIDHVVATHNDGDHAGGLRTILEEFEVGALWMLRPWLYASELIDRFARYQNPDNLARHLREVYSNLAALEDIAIAKDIPILTPFQGASIGQFKVMAPTAARYLDLVVASDKTPEATKDQLANESVGSLVKELAAKITRFVKSAWGIEVFPSEGTSAENEMSVVQFAKLCDCKILLTADTGRFGLQEVIEYAPAVGLTLPGIDRFQVPHHGSRRNVNGELLDKLLGAKLTQETDERNFTAVISSAKADEDHPRKAVVRAMHHRGAKVVSTEGASIRIFRNAPTRSEWEPISGVPYPEDQEE